MQTQSWAPKETWERSEGELGVAVAMIVIHRGKEAMETPVIHGGKQTVETCVQISERSRLCYCLFEVSESRGNVLCAHPATWLMT